MAELVDTKGQRLVLEPLRWEFSTGTNNDYDANWVVTRLKVTAPTQHWTAEAPAFLSWELQELAGWMRQVADAPEDADEYWSCMELNLSLFVEGKKDPRILRVVFELEYRPAGMSRDVDGEFWIDFQCRPEALMQFAGDLDRDLSEFPVRLVEHDGPARFYLG